MSHVAHTNNVISHVQMSHVTYTNESWHTHKGVMSQGIGDVWVAKTNHGSKGSGVRILDGGRNTCSFVDAALLGSSQVCVCVCVWETYVYTTQTGHIRISYIHIRHLYIQHR